MNQELVGKFLKKIEDMGVTVTLINMEHMHGTVEITAVIPFNVISG